MATERKLSSGEEEILDMLAESTQATQRLYEEYDRLKASYPDQWVAVGKGGLITHHKDLAGVITAFREAGYTGSQVAVEFLDTEPPVMIL